MFCATDVQRPDLVEAILDERNLKYVNFIKTSPCQKANLSSSLEALSGKKHIQTTAERRGFIKCDLFIAQ